MKEIFNRSSVRSFLTKPVEDEKIEQLLRAAMQAPSAGNQQPWEFIVVTDEMKLKELSKVSQYAKALETSPLAIVVLGNEQTMKYPENWEQDLGAATQNIQLMCEHLALGTVWLGIAPLDNRMEYVRDCFKLGDHLRPYAILPIGYPKNKREVKSRYDESKVHYNQY